MKFRKNEKTFRESMFFSVLLILISLMVLPSSYGFDITRLTVLFLGLIPVLNFTVNNEYIVINESGISCTKLNNVLWEYSWNEISELRKITHNRRICVEIILYDDSKYPEDNIRQFAFYFQLGKSAKRAIDLYGNQKF